VEETGMSLFIIREKYKKKPTLEGVGLLFMPCLVLNKVYTF